MNTTATDEHGKLIKVEVLDPKRVIRAKKISGGPRVRGPVREPLTAEQKLVCWILRTGAKQLWKELTR